MPLDQNLHQTVTRFACVDFSMYACGFSMLQMRQFCLFTYLPSSKLTSSENMFFFLPKSASSVSQSQAHLAKRIKTNYLSNQAWYHSRNKHQLKKKRQMANHTVCCSWHIQNFIGIYYKTLEICSALTCLYIHTHNNWSLQPFSQDYGLFSQYHLKLTLNSKAFEKLFTAILFSLRVFFKNLFYQFLGRPPLSLERIYFCYPCAYVTSKCFR